MPRVRKQSPCPRTGLRTSECECAIDVPDLTKALTAEQIAHYHQRAKQMTTVLFVEDDQPSGDS